MHTIQKPADITALPRTLKSVLKTSQTHPLAVSWIVPTDIVNDGKHVADTKQRCQSSQILTVAANIADGDCTTTNTTAVAPNNSEDDGAVTAAPQFEENGFDAEVAVVADAQQQLLDMDPVIRDQERALLDMAALLAPSGGGNTSAQGTLRANLALSSCPGKKVRLDGHGVTRTRPPVNRDLAMDFERLAKLEVRLVVNLLGDAELSFLGAPYGEYADAASQHGVEVLRYPVVEGDAPDTIAHFEQHVLEPLDRAIQSGQNVLCHCRGGIGRAGLVACCWLLKRGFCTSAADAIKFVRIRRSPKAIETDAQEHFIERYAEHLRRREAR